MAVHGQLSRLHRNLGKLAAIPASAGTHSADWVLGTSINFLIHEEQSVLEAERRQCEEEIAALEATWERLPRSLRSFANVGLSSCSPQWPSSCREAEHLDTFIPSNSPNASPILEILLHNLDGVQETVMLWLFEDWFTTECILDGLHQKLRLDANISPRFYIKSINAHKHTNNGTRWKLVSPTQPLDRHQRELHVVLRTEPYTLVLLGHEWRWKADRT
ncbi:hypothetical protein BS47DRAFT_1365458 [Hydnum rufescens UP504]|uniref:Uncharacterized protein n=1 Tax=Hydnum rufescens UP504 TaxID=1448309 RepID=A0A9P6ANI4_9AGAM|nr:hypothetical protein BS47DRAFT_1365458 [Hydnum rufescens UP504]